MKKTNLISLIILILALGAAVAGLSLAAGGGSAAGRAEMSAEDHLARAKLGSGGIRKGGREFP